MTAVDADMMSFLMPPMPWKFTQSLAVRLLSVLTLKDAPVKLVCGYAVDGKLMITLTVPLLFVDDGGGVELGPEATQPVG